MMHELQNIISKAKFYRDASIKSVLATVVFLEGSSYRKPGVRMLISEKGEMTGAVSGGCVENEIKLRAENVFARNTALMMTYDGRYRLGCEGILYILLEPFFVSEACFLQFNNSLALRQEMQMSSSYKLADDLQGNFGSEIRFKNNFIFRFNPKFTTNKNSSFDIFQQFLKPIFKLIIIGTEHDAVILCKMASLIGWEVEVMSSIKNPKNLADFPGANKVGAKSPESIIFDTDEETAVILMTHNYALDLQYLLKMQNQNLSYIGILGSVARKEQLFTDIIEYIPEVSEEYLDKIFSPTGLDIGAITPEEIAVSIIAEILKMTRKAPENQACNALIEK